ncbi:MAG: HEAT repeat domain-containing protein [Dehalococcoidia bacterium]|nr:HEAT repeat domain-containing protein [Dehalococcoidia bacterium]
MVDNEVQGFREALKSPDINIRREAAGALGEIGPGAKDAVPELIEALDDEDMDLIAVWSLGRIGPAAIAAVPAIKRWLEKVNSSCRPRSYIQGQLPYLPEDKRRPFEMNTPYNYNQDEASKHRGATTGRKRCYSPNDLQEKALRPLGAYRIVDRRRDGCLIVEATNNKRYFIDYEGHVFEEIYRAKRVSTSTSR